MSRMNGWRDGSKGRRSTRESCRHRRKRREPSGERTKASAAARPMIEIRVHCLPRRRNRRHATGVAPAQPSSRRPVCSRRLLRLASDTRDRYGRRRHGRDHRGRPSDRGALRDENALGAHAQLKKTQQGHLLNEQASERQSERPRAPAQRGAPRRPRTPGWREAADLRRSFHSVPVP